MTLALAIAASQWGPLRYQEMVAATVCDDSPEPDAIVNHRAGFCCARFRGQGVSADLGMDVPEDARNEISAYVTTLMARLNHRMEAVESLDGLLGRGTFIRVEVGWPFHAFCGWKVRAGVKRDEHASPRHCGTGFAFSQAPQTAHDMAALKLPAIGSTKDIPIRPMFPGLLGNVILFTLALWIVETLLKWRRGLVRIRWGDCPQCAYPIGVSPVCTECGVTLPISSPVDHQPAI